MEIQEDLLTENIKLAEENKKLKEELIKLEKRSYDFKQLYGISKTFAETLEFSTLIEAILYICMGQMRVLSAAMFIEENIDSNDLSLADNYTGFYLDPNISYVIPEKHALLEFLRKEEAIKIYKIDEIISLMPKNADLSVITSLQPSFLVPLRYQNLLNGVLLLGEKIEFGNQENSFEEDEIEHILSISSLASVAINNSILIERSSTDMMTHLKLKYYFYKTLEKKMSIARENNLPICVAMFDVDFFKRFNDTYGHACGDFVLQHVAKILQNGVRDVDLAARYGGEEFVVMFYGSDLSGAELAAERIRKTLEKSDIVYDDFHMQITISVGVAEFNANDEKLQNLTPSQLVSLADKALYESKRNGRNRVTCATYDMIKELESSKEE